MDALTERLLAARDGDRRALEDVVRATQADVWRLCRHLGDPDNVDDLVQETYARALRSLPRFRHDGSARGWLLTIARNTCADAARSRRRMRLRRSNRELPDVAVDDPDRTVVDELVSALEPDRRDAFVLTQLVGCSYAEAAEVMGCPIGTVRSRVARARDDLLAAMERRDRAV